VCGSFRSPRRAAFHSSPNLLAWQNAPLERIARSRLGVYTVVDNDANAAAYGEYFRGCAAAEDFHLHHAGDGGRGGIVIDGRPLRGSRNFAGRDRSRDDLRDGAALSLRQPGCLEAYLGAYALVRRRGPNSGAEGAAISRVGWRRGAAHAEAHCGSRVPGRSRGAERCSKRRGRTSGPRSRTLINIFNPDLIAIAGGVAKGFHLMRPSLVEEVRRARFPNRGAPRESSGPGSARRRRRSGAALLARTRPQDRRV